MIDVAALGEVLIDFACISSDSDGYPTMAAHPGGAPANFLAALNKYGCKTAMLGKVGEDSFGKLLINTLNMAGIDTRGLIADKKYFTTLAFVAIDEHGEREFSFARKPGADLMLDYEELALNIIDEAKVFHFGTLSMTDEPACTTVKRTVEYAKKQGKLISFDPNLRRPLWDDLDKARDAMLWGLSKADFVKISDEESEFLFDCSPEEAVKKLIDEFGVKLALITLGAKGAFIANAAASTFSPCPKVKPVDTTGAGDICGGAALSRVLKLGKALDTLGEEELYSIVHFATTAASLSTEKQGGISSVPDIEAVNTLI